MAHLRDSKKYNTLKNHKGGGKRNINSKKKGRNKPKI